MEWFFNYIFPWFFIIFFLLFIVMFITVLFFNISIFRRVFKGFRKSDNFGNFNVKANSSKNYDCKSCGATLDRNVDVSPSGDVKCKYCNKWFNVHNN